jgi:hypothetical protein
MRQALCVLCLLLLLLTQVHAQPALVASVSAAGSVTSDVTTGSIDTTGANFIAVCTGRYFDTAQTVTDSKSNTYTGLTSNPASGNNYTKIWYVKNPTVGSGHTFTAGTNSFSPILVLAFSGMLTTGGAQDEDGNDGSSVGTLQAGSAAVDVANSLALACSAYTHVGSGETVTVNSSFVSPPTQLVASVSGSSLGGAFAYKIISGSGTQNVTFDFNGTTMSEASSSIAAFEAAAAAASPRHRTVTF